MNKKSKTIMLSLILIINSLIFAQEAMDYTDFLQNPFDLWLNNEMSSEYLIEKMDALEVSLDKESPNWKTKYWQAKAALIKGQILFETGQKKLSLSELERSQSLSMESIAKKDNSDSWRLMADAGSYIMLQKGMFYIMGNSSKVQDQAEMALELDPLNARASLIIAQYLTNAPKIAGGNITEGIEIFENLTKRYDLIDEDSFYIFMGLSEAMKKNDQIDESIRACRMALSYFPENEYGKDHLASLQ